MKTKDNEKIIVSEEAVEYYKKILERAMSNVIKDALKEFEQNVLNEKLRDLESDLKSYVDSKYTTV